MKAPSRIDGSICGSIRSHRPLYRVHAQRTRPLPDGSSARQLLQRAVTRPVTFNKASRNRCPQTSSWLLSTFLSPASTAASWSRPLILHIPSPRYSSSTAVATSTKEPQRPRVLSRSELLGLVDQQDAGTIDEHLQFARDPYMRRYAQPDGPNLVVSDRREDRQYPAEENVLRGNQAVSDTVWRLRNLVTVRLRHRHRVTLESLHDVYLTLPEPRMLYLPAGLRQRLLRALGTPERRDFESMLRYFAVVADVKNCGLTLRRAEWNYAMALASRYVGTATGAEMESALRLWKEMERDAGIRGNDVTFNILFDVASKAGNFTLAEMIYREMEARKIEFNRYHRVSLIHFFGLKMDANGVRAAYREMVEAGEMIDTVVLNCVMSGFLNSGEDGAAEVVYERMKEMHSMHSKVPDLPERDYVMNKVVTKVLMMFSKVGKCHPGMVETLQGAANVTPDLHTYRLLVNHFAVKVGDINKVARYLDEMKWFRVPLHGAIFLALFKGFYLHGGYPDSDWSEKRLKSVYAALLEAFDEGARGLYIDDWLAGYVLRAFMRCSPEDSSEQTVREAYVALSSRWNLDDSKGEFMADLLAKILNKDPTVFKGGLGGLGRGGVRKRLA